MCKQKTSCYLIWQRLICFWEEEENSNWFKFIPNFLRSTFVLFSMKYILSGLEYQHFIREIFSLFLPLFVSIGSIQVFRKLLHPVIIAICWFSLRQVIRWENLNQTKFNILPPFGWIVTIIDVKCDLWGKWMLKKSEFFLKYYFNHTDLFSF